MPQTKSNLLLVVDDAVDFIELITEIAERVGYQVVAAANAVQFRESLVKCKPSLIFVDMQMPDMDGVEVLRQLSLVNARAGVFLISGMDQRVLSSTQRLGTSFGLKMLGMLRKPAMLQDIEAVLTANFQQQESKISGTDLQTALREQQLQLYYQPILHRHGSEWRMRSVEALLRWQHPTRGLLLPGAFLSVAATSQLIHEISDFVLVTAVQQVREWHNRGLELGVAINLATQVAQDFVFPDRLEDVLDEYGVAPERLSFEVKETASTADWDLMMDSLARLRLKGVGLSLDDFGTGNSSLTYLYKMPFDKVKIDHKVIGEITALPAAATIVKSFIDLAHGLSMAVVAEGVQTRAAFDLLERAGCDYLQGRFISEPLPAADIEQCVINWSSNYQQLLTG